MEFKEEGRKARTRWKARTRKGDHAGIPGVVDFLGEKV